MKKLNNKGFTLAELLATIVILTLVLLVAVPSILGVNKSVNKNLYKARVKNIELAAKSYSEDNPNLFLNDTYTVSFSLGYLQEKKIYNDDLKNPINGKDMKDCMVTVTKTTAPSGDDIFRVKYPAINAPEECVDEVKEETPTTYKDRVEILAQDAVDSLIFLDYNDAWLQDVAVHTGPYSYENYGIKKNLAWYVYTVYRAKRWRLNYPDKNNAPLISTYENKELYDDCVNEYFGERCKVKKYTGVSSDGCCIAFHLTDENNFFTQFPFPCRQYGFTEGNQDAVGDIPSYCYEN